MACPGPGRRARVSHHSRRRTSGTACGSRSAARPPVISPPIAVGRTTARQMGPIVEPGPFGALTGAQPPPALGRHVLEPVLDRLEAQPRRAAHRRHAAAPMPVEQAPLAVVRAAGAVARHPRERHARRRRPLQHGQAELGPFGTARVVPIPAGPDDRLCRSWWRMRPPPARRPWLAGQDRRPGARAGGVPGRSARGPWRWHRPGSPGLRFAETPLCR